MSGSLDTSALLRWLALSLVAVMLLPGRLPAAQVRGLYSAEVPVAGQEAELRNQAINEAFTRVLVKVSGSRTITARPEVAALLSRATAYVQQYRYRVGSEIDPRSGEPVRYLQVSFDPVALNRLMRQSNLPVWGDNRPGLLVWLGREQAGRRQLVRAETDSEIALWQALEQAGRQRGIPLLLPLMDLQDQTSLREADLWGGFEQVLREASRRYSPDLILSGRLIQVDQGLWRADWTLFQPDGRVDWSDQGNSAEALARLGIERAADKLAERYAPVSVATDSSSLQLRVEGVKGFADLVAIERLLRSQNSVVALVPLQVEPGAVTYRVRIRGSFEVLESGLSLGNLLEPLPAEAQDPQAGIVADLIYRLRQ